MIDDEALSGDAQLDAHVKRRTAEAAPVDVFDVHSAVQDAAEKMFELRRFGLDEVVQHRRRRDIANRKFEAARSPCLSLLHYCTTPRPERSDEMWYLDDGRRLASSRA